MGEKITLEDLDRAFEKLKRQIIFIQKAALDERKAREELVRLGQFEGLEAALERGRQAYNALSAPGD